MNTDWRNSLTGTADLARLILRRDRIVLPLWVILIALIGIGIGASFTSLYATTAALKGFIQEIAGNPAEVMMLGPVYAPTTGGLLAWRWTLQGIILAGLASLLTVVAHTRTDEESGRRELLGGTQVGRGAPLAATLLVTCTANLILGLLAALGMLAIGMPPAGSFALGLSVAAASCVIAAIAGVVVQLTQSAGAARGITILVFALFYMLRAAGDTSGKNGLAWLSWLSPLGWARLTRPFAGERWWVFGLFIGLFAMMAALAFALQARRDLGAGLIKARSGPAAAAGWLNSPLALAWRLQRGSLIGWSAAFGLIGILFGYIAKTVTVQLSANPAVMEYFKQFGGRSGPSDAVFTLFLMTFGEVFAVYAILTALRMQSEESSGHAEMILTAPVKRLRWAGSHLVFAILNPAIVVAAFGLASGLTYGLSAGEVMIQLPRILLASLTYLPAVWVLTGISMVLFGLSPRLGSLAYGVLGVFLLIDLGNELGQLSPAVVNLSPFTHVPRLLLGGSATLPLLWLILIAAFLMAVGLQEFRRRDIS